MSYWYAYFADGKTLLIRARSEREGVDRAQSGYPSAILTRIVFVRKATL